MNIVFSIDSVYDHDCDCVAFRVTVNGADRRVLITSEAIQDQFGARANEPFSLTQYVDANRGRIESIATSKIQNGQIGDIMIKSGDFR